LIGRYGGETAGLLFPFHRKADIVPPEVPGLHAADGDEYRFRATMYWHRARCDAQIAGPKSVRLFHAYKDRLFVSVESDDLRAWYYDKDGEPIKDPPIPDRQLRTG